MRMFVLLLFFSSAVFAQDNFSVVNNSITWRHVFQSDLSEEQIKEILKKDAELNPISETFTGTSKPVNLNCEKSQPIFMRDEIQYFANVELKDGRYRVTVNKIQLIPSSTVKVFGVESTNDPVAYEDFQLRSRDGEIRGNKMAQNSLHCLDQYLLDKFSFKAPEEDSW